MRNLSSKRKLFSLVAVTFGGYCAYAGISIYKGEERFYKKYVIPVAHLLDPERAHNLAIGLARFRFFSKSKYNDPQLLKVELFGKEFPNPLGIAAGFDKDGKAIQGLNDMGFGFVEIGSVTPKPQPGNAKPRVFRLSSDLAVINRYGFNSEGHDSVYQRLNNLRNENYNGIVGVNLGKNKTSEEDIGDYVNGIEKFGKVADYLVINISSPNTPGLRTLQKKQTLENLLIATVKARNNLDTEKKPPLFLKLAPDLSYEELKDIADVIKQKQCSVDGLIISNTTVDRPDFLTSANKVEVGGLSGKPLRDRSTKMIKEMYNLTNGIPIIGVGGVSCGKDVFDKIKAGAVLVQIYTALAYEGPPVVSKIKRELEVLLKEEGFNSIKEAVGNYQR